MHLALDVGLTLGWAVGWPRQIIAAGAKRFGHWRKSMDSDQARTLAIHALRGFQHWVSAETLATIEHIVVEEPVIGSRTHAPLQRLTDAMYMHVLVTADGLGIPVTTVAPSTWKRRACGHGRAKDAAIKQAALDLDPGARITTDHEAVARLLLHHYAEPGALVLTTQRRRQARPLSLPAPADPAPLAAHARSD